MRHLHIPAESNYIAKDSACSKETRAKKHLKKSFESFTKPQGLYVQRKSVTTEDTE